MIRIFLIAVFFLVQVFSGGDLFAGQTANAQDTSHITLAKIYMSDGTRLWGLILNENDSAITVKDFNTGIIKLSKPKITSIEKTKIETSVMVETTNGSTFFGRILGLREDVLILQSDIAGKIEIQTGSINKITLANAYLTKKGGTWFTNPNSTRYLFAPSAIPLRKREGYYQNAYLLANSVNVGVTNSITIGGGVVIPFLFYVTPKISFKVKHNLYLGGGVLFTQSFISDMGLSAGIAYGLVTVGNLEHNFTVGGGYGFSKYNNKYKQTPLPIVTINGMTRIGKRVSLITENWLIPRGGYNTQHDSTMQNGIMYTETIYVNKNYYSCAASLGMRLMPGPKTSIDFSVVYVKGDPSSSFLLLPYLDFVYKFE